jgi:hypothetical protein
MARARARDEMARAKRNNFGWQSTPRHGMLIKRKIADETGHDVGLDTARMR